MTSDFRRIKLRFMSGLSFKIYTLGCKVNQYDSGELAAKLLSVGFYAADKKADLAIINTCAVTKNALRKDRQMVVRARTENPGVKIVIVGCATRAYKEEMTELGVDLIIKEREAAGIVKNVKRYLPKIVAPLNKFGARNDRARKSRYFLKIQDGCRQFCSYCVIPYVRGGLRSRSVEEVISEAKNVARAGYREIVLCGIHLGLYGHDHTTHNIKHATGNAKYPIDNMKHKKNLVILLKKLIKIKALKRIRLSSIEVTEVSGDLISLMKKERKIARHLHLPLQSGCDKILKLMNRPYTTKFFAAKVDEIRKALPDVAITTDVITGFPGESDKDFKATRAFIEKIKFSKLHVFPFSAHERALAYKMAGQVKQSVKLARAGELRDLSARLEKDYRRQFAGRTLAVVVDGRSNSGRYRGKSEYYFDLIFKSADNLKSGDLTTARA